MEKADTYESALNFWEIFLIFVSTNKFSGLEISAKHQTKSNVKTAMADAKPPCI